MSQRWYVTHDGRTRLGPYSSAQLRQMARDGSLKPDDMILLDGRGKWTRAGSTKGLYPSKQPATQPTAQQKPPRGLAPMEAIAGLTLCVILSLLVVGIFPTNRPPRVDRPELTRLDQLDEEPEEPPIPAPMPAPPKENPSVRQPDPPAPPVMPPAPPLPAPPVSGKTIIRELREKGEAIASARGNVFAEEKATADMDAYLLTLADKKASFELQVSEVTPLSIHLRPGNDFMFSFDFQPIVRPGENVALAEKPNSYPITPAIEPTALERLRRGSNATVVGTISKADHNRRNGISFFHLNLAETAISFDGAPAPPRPGFGE